MGVIFFQDILTQYEGIGGTTIALTPTIGDPLLDKYFQERMQIINDSRITHVYFYTNLINYGEKIEKALGRVNNFSLKIFVSMAGYDKYAYLQIMGVDEYERVLENLERLSKYASEKRNISVKVKFIDYYGGEKAKEKMINLLGEKNIPFTVETGLDTWGGYVKEEISRKKMLARKVLSKRLGPCKMSYLKPLVTVEGKFKACDCRDYNNELVVGDLREKSLVDIWRGEEIGKLRNKMYNADVMPGICKKCELYSSIFDRPIFGRKNKLRR
jgi:radical SAM protein with 4Fe4S-binding SPASM domain